MQRADLEPPAAHVQDKSKAKAPTPAGLHWRIRDHAPAAGNDSERLRRAIASNDKAMESLDVRLAGAPGAMELRGRAVSKVESAHDCEQRGHRKHKHSNDLRDRIAQAIVAGDINIVLRG